MSYAERLSELERDRGRPVRVALVGAGQMGRGLAVQVTRVPGMTLAAVVDMDLQRAIDALHGLGIEPVVGELERATDVLDAGGALALGSSDGLGDLAVDVVVEATGVPDVGAAVALQALLAGQHAVVLNVEADVTVGHVLHSIARSAGLVYTVADGDEPVAAKELFDFAQDLAFDVVCVGKGKNNPLDMTATPDSVAAEAQQRNMNPKMLCSFVDGSKTMIEMAALANATGFRLDVAGMHGPAVPVDRLAEVFCPTEDGGILSDRGRVDYAFGPAPGVFCVVTSDNATVAEEMRYLLMGPGPYWSLYRPYHLASLEAPRAIARAVLDGRPAIRPVEWVAEVVAVAKRDLAAGEAIDGIGGETVYGRTYPAADADGLLPLGLAQGVTLQRPVQRDEPLERADCDVPVSTISSLRTLQERALGMHPKPASS